MTPDPHGDNVISLTDITKVGRYVVGLDPISAGPVFRRADTAPRATGGNGHLSVADYVQVGRYAAGNDGGRVLAHGPSNPIPRALGLRSVRRLNTQQSAAEEKLPSRVSVTLRTASAQGRFKEEAILRLDADGPVAGVGFSLQFDPAQVAFQRVELVGEAKQANLWLNDQQGDTGRIGCLIAAGPGQTFPEGGYDFVKVHFKATDDRPLLETNLAFVDRPIARQGSDEIANTLPVSFQMEAPGTPATATAYEDWAAGYASNQDQGSESTEAIMPDEDPDQDGLPNRLEYALGTEPFVADSTPFAVSQIEVDGEPCLQVTFKLRRDRTDVNLQIEASPDLVIWSSANVRIRRESGLGYYDQIQVDVPMTTLARFIRITTRH